MNNRIGLLCAVLVAQILLIAFLVIGGADGDDTSAPLVSFTATDIDRFSIGDGSEVVEVIRQGPGPDWQVAGVTADADKVTTMLEKLAAIDAGWPVATSNSSAARFEVSEDNFQRHIVLYAADATAAQLYLGTSPGYQRVHARRADSDDVFSVALSNHELGVSVDDWLDKGILALAETPQRIEIKIASQSPPGILESTAEGWLYNGVAANQDTAGTYANRFAMLRVLGLAEAEAQSQSVEQGAVTVTTDAGSQSYVISALNTDGDDPDDYLIRAQGDESSYRLATYAAEQLLALDTDFSPLPAQED